MSGHTQDRERMEFLQRELAQGFGLTEDERAELRRLESKVRP